MLCLLRVELELSIQAKADADRARRRRDHAGASGRTQCPREIRYLRSSIGTTGLLALHPVQ